MTIEGAIKRFESLIAMAEDRIRDFESCWPSMKSNFRKDKELYEMAVSALRAQADTPPNDPLTLDELKQLDDAPVWVEDVMYPPYSGWWIIGWDEDRCVLAAARKRGSQYIAPYYGRDWFAYRRKPNTQKEEKHEVD